MTRLVAYFDESGTNPGDVSTLAGFIAAPSAWQKLESGWSELLSSWGLGYFRMSKFANSKGPYARWSKSEGEERLNALLDIIHQNVLASVGFAVSKDMYAPVSHLWSTRKCEARTASPSSTALLVQKCFWGGW